MAGCNTTPLNRATVAPSATPPLQNTFAAGTDVDATTEEDNDVDHTDSTTRDDGDSQPLLDVITDPIIDALTAHARVLTSTIAGVDEADRALDLAITGVTKTLDDDVDDDTNEPPPTVPHGDVTDAPTMASMMRMLHMTQATNQAILNRLDAMDNTSKKNHGRLRAAINSKANSSKIARLDHRLEDMAHTIQDDINNTIGAQLTSATNFIIDLKVNLSHLTNPIGPIGQHARIPTCLLGLLCNIIRRQVRGPRTTPLITD